MNTVLIVQARMGSTRLPGKIAMDIGGHSMLARVVTRARRARSATRTIVATTTSAADDGVPAMAGALGVDVFRGDEDDVLDRYYQAARAARADVVVRVTADCPLIEPEILDTVVRAFVAAAPPADFAANTLRRTYPQGLDVEVASFAALERAWREARRPYQRSHVFPYLYENPQTFRLVSVTDDQDHAAMRWTVDTADDLAFVRAVYARFGNELLVDWRDVVALLDREPELLEINAHVQHKALEAG